VSEIATKRKKGRPHGARLGHEEREFAIRAVTAALSRRISDPGQLRVLVNKALTDDARRRWTQAGAHGAPPAEFDLSLRSVQSYIKAAQDRVLLEYRRPPEEIAAEQLAVITQIQAQAMAKGDVPSRKLALAASKEIRSLLGLDRPERHAHLHGFAAAPGGTAEGNPAGTSNNVAALVFEMAKMLPDVLPRSGKQLEDEREYADVIDEEEPDIVHRETGPGDEVDFEARRREYAGSSEAVRLDDDKAPAPNTGRPLKPIPDFQEETGAGLGCAPAEGAGASAAGDIADMLFG
jgi:hypothetical protein